jgi:hypothetical protein
MHEHEPQDGKYANLEDDKSYQLVAQAGVTPVHARAFPSGWFVSRT